MKNLVFAVIAFAVTVSVGAQASEMCEAHSGRTQSNYQVVKQVDAGLSRDAQIVSQAEPVLWVGGVTMSTNNETPMIISHLQGESVYAAERIVRHTIAAGECTLGNSTPGLPARTTCAIQVPGKVLVVSLVGSNNVVDGIVVDAVYGVPASIVNQTAAILTAAGNALNTRNGVLGFPFLVLSGVVTATGEVLQVVAYVVEAAVVDVVHAAVFVLCIPVHAIAQLLACPDKFLYNATFGLVGGFLKTSVDFIISLPKLLPASPCDGIGKDATCLK